MKRAWMVVIWWFCSLTPAWGFHPLQLEPSEVIHDALVVIAQPDKQQR